MKSRTWPVHLAMTAVSAIFALPLMTAHAADADRAHSAQGADATVTDRGGRDVDSGREATTVTPGEASMQTEDGDGVAADMRDAPSSDAEMGAAQRDETDDPGSTRGVGAGNSGPGGQGGPGAAGTAGGAGNAGGGGAAGAGGAGAGR